MDIDAIPYGVDFRHYIDDALSACHSTGAFEQKLVGPGLGKIFADADHPKLVNNTAATPDDAAGIIKNGFTGDIGSMPPAKSMQLTDIDISNVVAYLESLSRKYRSR